MKKHTKNSSEKPSTSQQSAPVQLSFDHVFDLSLENTQNDEKTPDAPKMATAKSSAAKTNVPKTNVPKTNAPKTNAPKTNAPKTNAPKTNAPKNKTPKTRSPENKSADNHTVEHTQDGTDAAGETPTFPTSAENHSREKKETFTPSVPNNSNANDSEMPHEARRVLVHLMRYGVILLSQKPKLYETLCRYEPAIRRHLSEVYLRLTLDPKMGVAFVALPSVENQTEDDADSGDNTSTDSSSTETISLITPRQLSLYDTLILLVLRRHYQERETAGEHKITIDLERLESSLTPFLPLTDHASLDRKRLSGRIKEMVNRRILSTLRGTEDRFEITPIIRYVVNVDFLESLLNEYQKLAQTTQNTL